VNILKSTFSGDLEALITSDFGCGGLEFLDDIIVYVLLLPRCYIMCHVGLVNTKQRRWEWIVNCSRNIVA